MRVLMTGDAAGGVWTYALELAGALSPHDVQVTLATMGPLPSHAQRAAAAAVPNLRLHALDYRLEWMEEPWRDVARAGDWLLELASEIRPELVHLNGYAHGTLPWRAPALVVGHSCVLSWWEAVRGEAAGSAWNQYATAVGAGLRGAARVAAPTGAMLAALHRHYGPLPAAKVLPNGCDPDRFRPARKEPFILAAGRLWDAAKNLAALARVAPELPWPVYCAGDRRPLGEPEDACGPADQESLRFLGRLEPETLRGWLARASIYALPARYEPFGLSVLEAAFSGCALVLGDIPTLREIWGGRGGGEGAARFVPPNDTAALRAVLLELIDRPAERQALAVRARARACEFTAERMAAAYLSTYRDLLAARPVQLSRPGH